MFRRSGAVLAAIVVAVLATGTFVQRAAAPVRGPAVRSATLGPTITTAPSTLGTTQVASLKGSIPGYPAPGAPSNTMVPGSWYGYPSILPVVAQQPGWLEIRLAQRPNESTTWVRWEDVTLSSTPYRIVIDLTTAHLEVFLAGRAVLDFPAGIGTTDDPTVAGSFFLTMTVPPPSPGYGPFVLVTSAHSDTISDWEQSGDAIIAIHGPIDSYDDSLIGTTGAHISHGCVRLHDSDLAQLANIPAGTPIDVVA